MPKKEILPLIKRGYNFLRKNRLDEAEECFIAALKIDEQNITALSNLGFIKYFQGNFQEGLNYCDRVLDISPKDPYSHKGKGLHLVKLGKLEEGIKYLKKAITLDPDFMDPYYDLALILYENGRPKKARKYILEAGKRVKDKEFRKKLTDLLKLVDAKKDEGRRKHLLSFEEIRENDILRVGGKAASLAVLKKNGLPVPMAFFLPVDIYRKAFQEYLSDFQSLPSSEQKKQLPRLQSFILDYKLNPDLMDEIEKVISDYGPPFAVRSSCPDEDSNTYSFAGIYLSILDLASREELEKAVKSVWSSLWSLQAFVYREERGILYIANMAVILQKQINPLISGVIFTRNPTTDEDEMVINATFGRGEELVSGKNIPEVIVLAVNKKDNDISWEIKSGISNLENKLIDEIARNACKIEEIFGCPQDIEWAYDGNFHILQARPITHSSETRWTREPVSDFMPEFLTPLSANFYKEYLDIKLLAFHENLGIKRPPNPLMLDYKGRLYVNQGVYNKVFDTLYDNELFYGYFQKIRFSLQKLPVQFKTYHRKIEDLIKSVDAPGSSFEELWDKFLNIKNLIYHEDFTFDIGYIHHILNDYYTSLLPEELSDYKDYLYTLPPTDHTLEIHTFQKELLESVDEPEIQNYLKFPADKSLPPKMKNFIEKYGHWTDSPLELARKRYREDHSSLIAILEALQDKKYRQNWESRSSKSTDSKQIIINIKKKYEHSIRRMDMVGNFNLLVDWIVFLVNQREENRKYTLLLADALRRIFLAIGEIMTKTCFAGEKEDIFFLNLHEIEIIKDLKKYQNIWLNYIDYKKRNYKELNVLSFPCEFTGGIPKPVIKSRPSISEGTKIEGLVLNRGFVNAPARVIKTPQELGEFRAGEILVVSGCDPYWSIVFPVTAGLISQTGGLLSHLAILTREYNIPAISAVTDATEIIETGDIVTLNASEGWIIIEKEGTVPQK